MSKIIVRVYAIILNENGEVLLTDEYRFGTRMTKFPGGGLIMGEGTIDCLKREALEEFGQPIEVIKHFYTTDFFQTSAFHKNAQIISIYYHAQFLNPIGFVISSDLNDLQEFEGSQIFRWIGLSKISSDDVTFPIDKRVVEMLKSQA